MIKLRPYRLLMQTLPRSTGKLWLIVAFSLFRYDLLVSHIVKRGRNMIDFALRFAAQRSTADLVL